MTHSEYMQSDWWKAVRQAYIESGRPQECVACGQPRFELHHVTYKRLGHELLDDLLAVCRVCHQEIHDEFNKRGSSLRKVTRAVIRRIRASLPRMFASAVGQLGSI